MSDIRPPTTHTSADPGADECAADAAGEYERDLADNGDLDQYDRTETQ